jgi:hypothetical protein
MAITKLQSMVFIFGAWDIESCAGSGRGGGRTHNYKKNAQAKFVVFPSKSRNFPTGHGAAHSIPVPDHFANALPIGN